MDARERGRPPRRARLNGEVRRAAALEDYDAAAIDRRLRPRAPEPRRTAVGRFWHTLGPGIVTGAADDDPSGIATYSVAGAQFGTAFLWVAVVTWPLVAAVQTMCARIGMVTGRGLTAALQRKFPRPVLAVACFAAMFFIILTTALTLHRAGITHVDTSRQVPDALRPLAGRWATLLYTVGLIGTGALAIPTLAGSAAYDFGSCSAGARESTSTSAARPPSTPLSCSPSRPAWRWTSRT